MQKSSRVVVAGLRGIAVAVAVAVPVLPAHAEPCRTSVRLEGEPALTGAVMRSLAARGVDTAPQPGCPVLRVELRRSAGHVAVTVVEEHRRGERVLPDEERATTFIESWARSDISQSLLEGHEPAPLAVADAAVADAAVADAAVADAAVANPAPAIADLPVASSLASTPRLVLSSRAELAVGGDGSLWPGAVVHAALARGPVQLGVSLRALGTLEVSVEDVHYRRGGVELLATAGLPIELGSAPGRARLVPELGVGVGWLAGAFSDDSGSGSTSEGGLRVTAELTLAVPLPGHLSLEVALGLEALLPPPEDQIARIVHSATDEAIEERLPAAPSLLLRAGVGVRWSSP